MECFGDLPLEEKNIIGYEGLHALTCIKIEQKFLCPFDIGNWIFIETTPTGDKTDSTHLYFMTYLPD